jgi:hypothetical protein
VSLEASLSEMGWEQGMGAVGSGQFSDRLRPRPGPHLRQLVLASRRSSREKATEATSMSCSWKLRGAAHARKVHVRTYVKNVRHGTSRRCS